MSEDSKNMNGLPDSEHFSDEEIVKSHVELSKNKHEPTKNFLIAPLVFVFVFGCLIFVCSIQLAHSTNSFQLHPPVEVVELTPEEKESQRLERKFSSGEKIFAARCASCHQANGLGIAGQFPPLAGSEWVSADPGVITNIILKGLKGEILVKGEKYGTSAAVNMAAVPISDREIANVSTYVRQAWGNSSDEVSEDFVKQVRADYSNKQDQWTGDELKSLYSTSF
ncbi:MAG: cytochrome c [Verrucomicrobia bacterium]|jgi:mono/diheme cytochrome c family protein|nr:cytochrome c [Verrucomicrobiota bacterium]MDA1077940.1 cytochrome c [Verrucomicrobiota bacterium]